MVLSHDLAYLARLLALCVLLIGLLSLFSRFPFLDFYFYSSTIPSLPVHRPDHSSPSLIHVKVFSIIAVRDHVQENSYPSPGRSFFTATKRVRTSHLPIPMPIRPRPQRIPIPISMIHHRRIPHNASLNLGLPVLGRALSAGFCVVFGVAGVEAETFARGGAVKVGGFHEGFGGVFEEGFECRGDGGGIVGGEGGFLGGGGVGGRGVVDTGVGGVCIGDVVEFVRG